MENRFDKKSGRVESRSRLPRMSAWTQSNGQQKGSIDTSSIPRPTKTVNNNQFLNKLILCNSTDREDFNASDNSRQNYKTIICPQEESFRGDISTDIKTSLLCKSQSLNEIQYENNYLTKVNNFTNNCDAVKAFSFEQLDENLTHSNRCSYLTKDEIMDSDNNFMEMSIDESSTASLGLLPNIMSSISPFDTFSSNIPTDVNYLNDSNMTSRKNDSVLYANNDGDDDSENGIPTIEEDESDSNLTITDMDERPVTPLVITNALNSSIHLTDSLDNTMESINSIVVNQEMADEFETMNLDNSINESDPKSDISSADRMSFENNVDNSNKSETNIPIVSNSLYDIKDNEKVFILQSDKSSRVTVKSLNESKSLDSRTLNSKPLDSKVLDTKALDSKTDTKVLDSKTLDIKNVNKTTKSSVRPTSLNTTGIREVINTEKVQRAASPSSRASVRKKIKTPGRWDAVMNKIEQSKTNSIQSNKPIKGRVNTNLSRNTLQNGSLPKISPLSELSIDIDSSHLTPSTPSTKSSITSFTKATTASNTITKVNIPKSKTFVRDTTTNDATGNKSRQPPAPVTQPAATKKGVVTSINDKKSVSRRPTLTNTSKRVTHTKTNPSITASTTSAKKDSRSAQLIDDKQQILKLTQLCEYKTKQLKTLCLDHNYIRLAFDSLSIVIQHLIEQYAPFENPKLKQALQNANKRCEQLKDNLDAKDVELNDMKIIYEEQINQLMKEREKNYSDLNQAKVNHEANIKKLHQIHSWELNTLQDKHNRELQISQQNFNQLLSQIEDHKSQLNQTLQLKDALEIKVSQMEENIMNDKDKKFKYLTEKTKQLELEVDSLKVVMDMKNEKIHALERQMIETQEKINELPMAKETIRGLQQQIENLQVTLERKIHQFNQLTREHEELKSEYDREMREKRRLSMKNEELAYHLSESFHNESTNFDSNNRWKSPALITDETPIKTNRAFIVNASASASASVSSRKAHSKIIKSMSTSMSSTKRTTPAIYCRSSNSVSENENSFLSNGTADDVFDVRPESNMSIDSGLRSHKYGVSSEMPPQCILDSGFEEIQGLNSLPK